MATSQSDAISGQEFGYPNSQPHQMLQDPGLIGHWQIPPWAKRLRKYCAPSSAVTGHSSRPADVSPSSTFAPRMVFQFSSTVNAVFFVGMVNPVYAALGLGDESSRRPS